jgi:anti-sigma regulatory factor (Ser/Thr protein kinase)
MLQATHRADLVVPYITGNLDLCLPSMLENIKGTVSYLQHFFSPLCRKYHLDHMRLSLCIHEALSNAVIHGNLAVPSVLKEDRWEEFESLLRIRESTPEYNSRRVNIKIMLAKQRFQIEIKDEGEGFDVNAVSEFINPGSMLPSGRGILLIHSFMDEVRWNEKGNKITMIKNYPSLADKEA